MNAYFSLGHKCNLKCIYCYNNSIPNFTKLNIGNISVDVMERITRFLHANYKSIRINFTGGETFLYFSLITELLDRIKDIRSTMADPIIVTNGSLITEKKLSMLKEIDPNVVFSVSFDGPPEIHNKQRVTSSIKNSHTLAVSALTAIKQAKFKLYINSVLTRNHQQYGISKFYKYMQQLDIPWLIGKGSFLNANEALTEKEFSDIVLELISEWEQDPNENDITWIDGILAYLVNQKEGNFSEHCGSDAMISFAGERALMWACPRFIPYQEYCLGEFSESTYWTALNSPNRRRLEDLFNENICAYESHLFQDQDIIDKARSDRKKLFSTIDSKVDL